MARKRKKQEMHPGELNLTAMIDVAFQLLNFFVITLKPVDVYTNLDMFRPAPESKPPPVDQPMDMLEIMVYKEGYVLQRRNVALEEVDRQLKRLADISQNVSIIVKCTGDSKHDGLVQVLNVCAKHKLTKVSVFSL